MDLKAFCCFLFALSARSVADEIMVTTPPSVNIAVGETLEIQCSWTRENAQLNTFPQLAWFAVTLGKRERVYFKDGQHEKNDDVPRFKDRIAIKDGFTLVINDTIPSDSGNFVCTVSAGVEGAGESRTKVDVCSPPQISITGRTAPVDVDADAVKIGDCFVYRVFPQPNITWYKNTTPLPKESQKLLDRLVNMEGYMTLNSSLIYKPQKADKNATYHCRVTYKMPGLIQSIDSQSFSIIVHYPADHVELVVWEPRGAKHVTEGDDVVLRCVADANPPPRVVFYHNGTQILDGVTGDKLHLPSMKRTPMAEYACIVITTAVPAGKLEAKLLLEVREDNTVTIIVAVMVTVSVLLIAVGVVLGLFFTKKLCFAPKKGTGEEDVAMNTPTSTRQQEND